MLSPILDLEFARGTCYNTRMKNSTAGYVLFLAVAGVVKVVMDCLPDEAVEMAFMRPAAHLAALYLGVKPEYSPLAISARGVVLEVTRACSATDFFSILLALLAIHLRVRRLLLRLGVALVSAWAVAILANAARLATLVFADRIFPAAQWPLVHLIIGVVMFFSLFFAVYLAVVMQRV